jgi:hypothetical protein
MGSDKKAAHIVWESDRARTTYIVNRVPLTAFSENEGLVDKFSGGCGR